MTDPTTASGGVKVDMAETEAGESSAIVASDQVPADMQALIGRQLRAVFDDIAKQPVPDRFLELMRQLE